MGGVIVIGCGGHAKSVIDVLKLTTPCKLAGFVTPEKGYPTIISTASCIGTYNDFDSLLSRGISNFIAAIGDNRLRKDMFDAAISAGLRPINAVSPHSYISNDAELGRGVLVMHGAVINTGTKVDDNCIINTMASIDHDCHIKPHSHICPGSVLAGTVTVEEGALLGAGCNVLPKITIGRWAVCGAGSTVIRNVEPYATVIGVPAKKM